MTYELGVGPIRGRHTWSINGKEITPLIAVSIQLANGEFITGVKERIGDMFDSLDFITNRDTYGPYGGNGGGEFRFEVEYGRITGIFGGTQAFGGEALSAHGFFYV